MIKAPCLYLDVDDTLIMWLSDELYEPNEDVLRFVRLWREEWPTGKIVVWSSGGKNHAQIVGQQVLGGIPHTCMSKQPIEFRDTDIFIDDDPMDFFSDRCIHPMDLT